MKRPRPPLSLVQPGAMNFVPAPKVWTWALETFVNADGPLYNPTHRHLTRARVGLLWTNVANVRAGRVILGQAEMPRPKGGIWQKERQALQLREWFGCEPDFTITLYAPHADACSNLEFCALLEHEMLHCAQARDMFGALKFRRDGRPALAMRGHDVEEFVDIVERYGAVGAGPDVVRFVEAVWEKPTVGPVEVAQACGTCLPKAA